MADVPSDLLDQINRLEELFTVPTDKLKAISDHFVSELAKGLSKEGGSIVSCDCELVAAVADSPAHEPNLVHGLSTYVLCNFISK